MFFQKIENRYLRELLDRKKPVSTITSRDCDRYKKLIDENIENKSIVHIPTDASKEFPELSFGESIFYCLPDYVTWARILYYTFIAADDTLYNKKDNVFVFSYGPSVFEIDPLVEDGPPKVTKYPGAKLPFYKEGILLDQLAGTTYLAGRLLGYPDEDYYVPTVIVPQYKIRSIFDDLYKHKFPMNETEIKEEESLEVYDFRGKAREHSSPQYVERVSSLVLKDQKDFANWFMENRLNIIPGPYQSKEDTLELKK